MDINMKGVWLSCQAEKRAMLAHGQSGSIVNIAFMSGVIVNRGLMQVHYNASKADVSICQNRWRWNGLIMASGSIRSRQVTRQLR